MAFNGSTKKEFYREDYIGEFIVKRIVVKDGRRVQEREWVENILDVEHVSNRATCISNDLYFKDSFYKQIQNNNGGNLGKLKMLTYGVENVCKLMEPDFLVVKDSKLLENLIMTQYTNKSTIYTSARNCVKYPGKFYLLPHNLSLNAHAMAIWLACFDGHKEIYIVGYDHTNIKLVNSIENIINTYQKVKFIHITNNNSPHEWKQHRNFSAMSKELYVSHCDI